MVAVVPSLTLMAGLAGAAGKRLLGGIHRRIRAESQHSSVQAGAESRKIGGRLLERQGSAPPGRAIVVAGHRKGHAPLLWIRSGVAPHRDPAGSGIDDVRNDPKQIRRHERIVEIHPDLPGIAIVVARDDFISAVKHQSPRRTQFEILCLEDLLGGIVRDRVEAVEADE